MTPPRKTLPVAAAAALESGLLAAVAEDRSDGALTLLPAMLSLLVTAVGLVLKGSKPKKGVEMRLFQFLSSP